MGLFDGLKDAQIFEQGNYFGVGIYDVRVIRCIVKQTYRSGLGFIAELEVLSSNNPAHAVGSKGTWFQSLTKNQATAFSAIKEFVAALYGFDIKADAQRIKLELEPHIEALMNEAVGPNNTFAGRCVHLETYVKKTREKGLDFTVHRWTPYRGEEPPAFVAPPPHGSYAPTPLAPPSRPSASPTPPATSYGPPAYAPPAPPVQAPPHAPAAPPVPVWNASTQSWEIPR